MKTVSCDFSLSNVAHLYVRNGITVCANQNFTGLTGYHEKELCGKSFPELLKKVLKSTWVPQGDELVETATECFIFTKDYTVKKVSISIQNEEQSSYITFVPLNLDFLHNNFRFLEHIHADTDTGLMILNAPCLTILKANSFITRYIESFYTNSESCVGDTIYDIFRHFGGAPFEPFKNTNPLPDVSRHINEFRYDFPLRGVTYWDLILAPTKDESNLNYIILIVKEVTETVLNRLRLEEQAKTIQDKNQQLQAIFDNVSDGLYIEDYSDGKTTTLINRHTARFLKSIGIPEQTPEGFKEFHFYDREGNPVSPENLPITRMREGERYEQSLYTFRHMDQEIHLSISGSPLFDAEKKLKMAILCAQLATDRVVHEKELQQQRDLYYNIFDVVGLPIIYLSYPDFICLGLNRNAFGIIRSYLKGTPMETLLNPDIIMKRNVFKQLHSYFDMKLDVFKRVLAQMEEKRETVFYQFELLLEKKKVVYKLVIQPIIKNNREIKEVIITGIDITAEIEQREAAERLVTMKDELVYTISHEFKTPLTVIFSAVQAMELLCWNDLPEKAKDYVKKIKQNAFRQLRLVNNLLDMNKTIIGKMKLNLNNLDIVQITKRIIESVQVYAQQKGIRLSFSSSVEERIMGIDDEKYERILLNLLSNAIKFTSSQKAVYVRVSLKRYHQRLMACIEVEDEGIGIPEDKFDLIFERFAQIDSSLSRNVEGSGLGLAIVRQLVKALGGELTVNSIMGEGSTFTILLPARKVPRNMLKNNVEPSVKNVLKLVTAMEMSDIHL
ncbi:MAG: HAMP domain-containing histidine kinase [Ruminiclostridium sp.]|nr:HAMP domain-containing histidine kinase [Ruminiclostridium sp.]